MLTQLVVCLAVLGADDAVPANAQAAVPKYKVGAQVVVIRETPLRVDDRAVKQLPPGTALAVEENQDGFLGVTAGRQGWVDEKDVAARDKALEALTDQLARDADNIELRKARGEIAAEQKKWDTAIEDFTQLLRLEPGETQHYVDRGQAFTEQREWDKAIADFNEAVKRSDDPTEALMLRATAWDDKGESEKALADFDEALKQSVDDRLKAEILRRRGDFYVSQRNFEKAFADLNEALTHDRIDPWILISRARANVAAEKLNAAIVDYSAAIYLDKQNVAAYAGRADAFRKKHDYDNAQFNLDQATKIAPNSSFVLFARAQLHDERGKHKEAVDDYNELLKLDDNDRWANNNLAWLQATCPEAGIRNGAAAVERAKKAVELTQNKEPGVIDTLAAAYAEIGDFEKAIDCQQHAIELTTDQKQRDDLRTRLELYQQHKPYREKPGANSAN